MLSINTYIWAFRGYAVQIYLQVATKSYPKTGMAAGSIPIRIGDSGNTVWSRFNGKIDEVRIWSRTLTDAEIGGSLRR